MGIVEKLKAWVESHANTADKLAEFVDEFDKFVDEVRARLDALEGKEPSEIPPTVISPVSGADTPEPETQGGEEPETQGGGEEQVSGVGDGKA